ncbi:MAG TPA: YraN family protein [Steroidobacteraceae bacterium]|nr:YraN family protein [Steroidobacteraceae bacterium]
MSPHDLGAAAERVAADYLRSQGMEVLLKNYRRRLGELDIVARSAEVLAIVEVRTRSSNAFGGAAASVTGVKQRRVVRAAQQLLQRHRELARLPVRFDVIVVCDAATRQPRVEWLRSAFSA